MVAILGESPNVNYQVSRSFSVSNLAKLLRSFSPPSKPFSPFSLSFAKLPAPAVRVSEPETFP